MKVLENSATHKMSDLTPQHVTRPGERKAGITARLACLGWDLIEEIKEAI